MFLAVLVKYLEWLISKACCVLSYQSNTHGNALIKWNLKPFDTIFNASALQLELRKGQEKDCKKEKWGRACSRSATPGTQDIFVEFFTPRLLSITKAVTGPNSGGLYLHKNIMISLKFIYGG